MVNGPTQVSSPIRLNTGHAILDDAEQDGGVLANTSVQDIEILKNMLEGQSVGAEDLNGALRDIFGDSLDKNEKRFLSHFISALTDISADAAEPVIDFLTNFAQITSQRSPVTAARPQVSTTQSQVQTEQEFINSLTGMVGHSNDQVNDHEVRMGNLERSMDFLLQADDNPANQIPMAMTRTALNVVRAGRGFWEAQGKQDEHLKELLSKNPGVFTGKPEEAAAFQSLLDERNNLQNTTGDLLGRSDTREQVANNRVLLEQNYLKLQTLASGGSIEQANQIAETHGKSIAEASTAVGIYESDITELQNIMDSLVGARETQDAAEDIRVLLNLTRAKLGFWREQDQNLGQLSNTLAENSNEFMARPESERQYFESLMAEYKSLQAQIDGAIETEYSTANLKSRLDGIFSALMSFAQGASVSDVSSIVSSLPAVNSRPAAVRARIATTTNTTGTQPTQPSSRQDYSSGDDQEIIYYGDNTSGD